MRKKSAVLLIIPLLFSISCARQKPAEGQATLVFSHVTIVEEMLKTISEKAISSAEIFKLNVETYPQSGNVYDSLAEAYMAKGEKDLAIKNYEKSLELDPKNTNAVEMLKKLKAK